ncbi:hypothetical protein Lal_00002488 [Lupinus albus]|uniref:Uncharacterized protein n=1 Tax=Lupinus albus TaxID=3870 RepID=A0A6A5P8Y1_LUPAL|nr:hypothetical protein Lalb_Chr11g0065291 [Lupinus albus]KAF1893936.1 hypothetical protein Lal_00002488 [Lupinus albus]
MDKISQSCGDSSTSNTITTSTDTSNTTVTTTATTTIINTNQNYLKKLNKLSQKITKPIIKKPNFDPPPPQNQTFNNPDQNQNNNNNNNNVQHQPPVYNISKSDFRDVVQKLTGSPAHDRTISNPPPIHQPKPPSSRLHRIRPPPLAQISNRPQTPLLNPPPPFSNNAVTVNNNNFNFSGFGRPLAPLSPLPPFPTVHAAAESPVSAYLRCIHNSMPSVDSNSKQFSGFSPLAPRWNNFAPPQQEQQQQLQQPESSQQVEGPSSSQSQFQMPTSPLPFGCLNSPISSYPLFSPNSGQLGFPQLPLSPTVPVQSPRWKDL